MNNNLKCKWIKCSNQKTQGSGMDKKTWPTYMLPTRDPPQNKGPKQTESGKLETNFPRNWAGKKKLGQQYLYQKKQTSEQKPLKETQKDTS